MDRPSFMSIIGPCNGALPSHKPGNPALANEEPFGSCQFSPANKKDALVPPANEVEASGSCHAPPPVNEEAGTEHVSPTNEKDVPSFQIRTYRLFMSCLLREIKDIKAWRLFTCIVFCWNGAGVPVPTYHKIITTIGVSIHLYIFVCLVNMMITNTPCSVINIYLIIAVFRMGRKSWKSSG